MLSKRSRVLLLCFRSGYRRRRILRVARFLPSVVGRRGGDEMDRIGRLLTTEEAAARLRMSPHTLRNIRSLGRGPEVIRQGRSVFYDELALETYLLRSRRRPRGSRRIKG